MDLTSLNTYMANRPVVAGILFLVLSVVVVILVSIILKKWVSRLVSKTKTDIDDILLRRMQRPFFSFLCLTSLKITGRIMEIKEVHLWYADKIIHALMILVLAHMVIALVDIFLNQWVKGYATRTNSKKDDEVLRLFHKFISVIGYLLALLFILQSFGVQVGPLFASLGIAGIAIAFALQDSLKNILGGVQLILDDIIRKGDVIKLEDQTMGTVLNVGLRTTRILTKDNEEVIVPNGKLADQKIINYFMPDDKIRVSIPFGVEYGNDPERVKKVAVESVSGVKDVMKDPVASCDFLKFGDSSMDFQLNFWVSDFDHRWPAHQEMMTKLHNALGRAKISIPFPTRTLYMHSPRKK